LSLQSAPVSNERASRLAPYIPKLPHAAFQAMFTAAAGWAVTWLLLHACLLFLLLEVIWHPLLLFCQAVLLQL
jgi:hypothetical protein